METVTIQLHHLKTLHVLKIAWKSLFNITISYTGNVLKEYWYVLIHRDMTKWVMGQWKYTWNTQMSLIFYVVDVGYITKMTKQEHTHSPTHSLTHASTRARTHTHRVRFYSILEGKCYYLALLILFKIIQKVKKNALTFNAKQFDYVVACCIFRRVGRNRSAYLFMPNYLILKSVNADIWAYFKV